MSGIDADHPWNGYKVYKIFHKKQGRFYAVLKKPEHRTTISWARYLMEVHLGKHIPRNIHVDHINNDKSDDRIENLSMSVRSYKNAEQKETEAWMTASSV